MSTSKSKHRECNNDRPIKKKIVKPDEQSDDQTGDSPTAPSPEQAQSNAQLDLLAFLNTLEEVPHDLESICPSETIVLADGVTRIEVKPLLPHMSAMSAMSSLPSMSSLHSVPVPTLPPVPAIPPVSKVKPVAPPASKPPLQTLLSHQFTHKLHLAASSERVQFINWTTDGKHLQLDYVGLQDHLTGSQCMFRSRSVLQFTRQLTDMGFERTLLEQSEQELEHGGRLQLYYKHEHFDPYHSEQLLLIPTPQTERQPTPKTQRTRPVSLSKGGAQEAAHRSGYTPLQLARFRFHTLLNYHNDVRLLQEREPSSEQQMPRRGRISSCRQAAHSALAPALASKHMNPRDSVLRFEAGKVPDYAGFYGPVEPTLISEFFAEYLPRYGASTTGYKDIVVDASKANSFQQNLPIGIAYSEDEDELIDHDRHEPSTPSAVSEPEQTQASESCQLPPEDIELEQVMQELCEQADGDVDVELELDAEKKEVTPVKPKLKRKKLARKCATADTEQEQEREQKEPVDEHCEDLLEAAAAAAACIKEEAKDKDDDSSSNNETDKELKCQPASKMGVKRRRYDLRNSKSKRTR
ncbi:uncharacterized protein LOC108657696 [Drosophila navojoa]|uniref:uncharacterized protein LOC108657696 n=1 Tax=Drosophila navojoa TaxID=7232 RepID=UPI0011BEB09E|nr:uncharacterized protein LOC108657696 [Drosophila navojoa]